MYKACIFCLHRARHFKNDHTSTCSEWENLLEYTLIVWGCNSLSEYLSDSHGALASSPAWQKPGVMVHTCHPGTLGGDRSSTSSHMQDPGPPSSTAVVREDTGADRCHGNWVAI